MNGFPLKPNHFLISQSFLKLLKFILALQNNIFERIRVTVHWNKSGKNPKLIRRYNRRKKIKQYGEEWERFVWFNNYKKKGCQELRKISLPWPNAWLVRIYNLKFFHVENAFFFFTDTFTKMEVTGWAGILCSDKNPHVCFFFFLLRVVHC